MSGEASGEASCLVWKPQAARQAQPLRCDASGTIDYLNFDPIVPDPVSVQVERRPAPQGMIAGAVDRLLNFNETLNKRLVAADDSRPLTLELRSGDTVPFRPTRIDSEGITFTTPVSLVTFVKHADVRAISLTADVTPAELTSIKRDRLLTVPRKIKEHPPTHLLLSTNQDILRGRLLAMDDQFVTIEVRMTPRRIPRDRVAAIVWLDVDAKRPQAADSEPASKASDRLQVLARKSDGNRITILPYRVSDNRLIGAHPVLETSQADIADLDRLMFGHEIQAEIDRIPTSQIVLTAAIDPKYLEADGQSEARSSGQESALVGQPAPSLKLKRLDGSKFDLAAYQGKVVVLDFWATWCGPCTQWMPRLDRIISGVVEDGKRNVELVTVNLGEEADVIRPVLERLGLNPTVLLDIDGVAAELYQAAAIPQTVVVDREGVIRRVFIGGGSQIEAPLREALEEL
jgi:thiol-disulfide isomerase/thioredoxin